MIPTLENTRYIRAYAGVRALLGTQNDIDDRSSSRGFTLLDHEQDGLNNFITITGGKLTTYRLMAPIQASGPNRGWEPSTGLNRMIRKTWSFVSVKWCPKVLLTAFLKQMGNKTERQV